MKILITGGCGFVGTNLALFLNSKGFKVASLDNLSRKGSKYNLSLLKDNKIKNFNFDIYNFNKIKKLPKYDLISVKESFLGKSTAVIKEFTAPFLGIYSTKELIDGFSD